MHRSERRLPASWLPRRRPLLGIALLAAAAASAGAPAAAQGETGFLRGKGKADVVLSYTHDSYDHFWFGRNRVFRPGVGTVRRRTYSLYAAYGVTDNADLIVKGSYIKTSSTGLNPAYVDESDFQDLTVSTKWRVIDRPTARGGELSLALLPGLKVPLTNYENSNVTALGDGQVDLQLRVVGQYRLASGAFAALETGYDVRHGTPHDEIPFHLTVGATVLPKLTLSVFYSDVNSLGGTDITGPATYFPANEEDYTRTGLSAYYRLTDHFGLAGNYRTTIAGRNTGDVDGYSIGVVFNLP